MQNKMTDKADAEWRRVAKSRDKGRCVVCGSPFNLDVHHLIERVIIEYRHVVENGLTMCRRDHNFSDIAPHRNKTNFFCWLRANRPDQYDWYLRHTVEKRSIIAGKESISRVHIKGEHRGDEVEYNELKGIV